LHFYERISKYEAVTLSLSKHCQGLCTKLHCYPACRQAGMTLPLRRSVHRPVILFSLVKLLLPPVIYFMFLPWCKERF